MLNASRIVIIKGNRKMIDKVGTSDSADALKLHYYFVDATHTMDAKIRNDCERELLHIANEIAKQLGLPIRIEVEGKKEGGLAEIYTFIFSQSWLYEKAETIIIQVFIGVLIHLITKPKVDSPEQQMRQEEIALNNKNMSLGSVLKTLQIEKVIAELEALGFSTANLAYEKILALFRDDIKIKKHKSNLYSNLQSYEKISKIETETINKKTQVTTEKICVERKDFYKYIIKQDEGEDVIDKDAIIEIISPVLVKEKYKWRGKYDKREKAIEFTMQDKQFNNSIIADSIKFQNGTFINCELQMTRKFNDDGSIYDTSFIVNKVFNYFTDNKIIETKHGKNKQKNNDAPLFASQ